MSKSVNTLQEDIYHVLETGEGWTEEISEFVAEDMKKSLTRQLIHAKDGGTREKTLRLSSIGQPCERKLWYSVNADFEPEGLLSSTFLKFLFGDLTESLLLGLVKASGHSVEGLQDTLVVDGIVGHRDCVIDGMVFDVKSASPYGFTKFKEHKLPEDDPFGYLSQLSSYVYASKDDPKVTEKTKGGFLAFNKSSGQICVDIYDLTELLEKKEEEIARKKELVSRPEPPERPYKEVPHGKSGNMKLPMQCSYCNMKYGCWGRLRKFIYSNGPVYLTKVVKEPEVFEVT